MKPTKEKHKQYTNSFKLTAVRLASHPDIQVQDVATALGIHPFMLSRWKKEHREGRFGEQAHANTNTNTKSMEEEVLEQTQVRELEKTIKRLELENALLKKSMQPSSEQN